jgi:hypothetical protein
MTIENNCNWETIEGFFSLSEYKRFRVWLSNQENHHFIEEIPVGSFYAGANFEEHWFICKQSGSIWRLVAPDAPFKGYWGPVE